ncbi:MAG: secretion system protein, partial [Pseudomonadota bacterium]
MSIQLKRMDAARAANGKPTGGQTMKRLTAKALLASIAVAPLAAVPTTTATAQQVVSPSQDVVLSIGRGQLVTVPGAMADV